MSHRNSPIGRVREWERARGIWKSRREWEQPSDGETGELGDRGQTVVTAASRGLNVTCEEGERKVGGCMTNESAALHGRKRETGSQQQQDTASSAQNEGFREREKTERKCLIERRGFPGSLVITRTCSLKSSRKASDKRIEQYGAFLGGLVS